MGYVGDVNLPLHLSHPTPCCCWCSTHGNLTTLPPTNPFPASTPVPSVLSVPVLYVCGCAGTCVCRFSRSPLTNCFVGQREEKKKVCFGQREREARECEPLTKKCFSHRVVYNRLPTKLNRSFSTHPSIYARTKRRITNERESFLKRTIKPRVYTDTYQLD